VYKKMLVPLDGSQLAEETLPYARELAGRLDLELDFLHVLTPAESQLGSMVQMYVARTAESVREQIQQSRGGSAGGKTSKSVKIASKVVTGYPAEEILKYADNNEIDIILMATHGASGIHSWAVGSVAYKVLHASKVPVWLVRSGIPEEIVYDKWPKKTLLVPLDGSKLAESAIPHAEELVKKRGTQVAEILLLSAYASGVFAPSHFFISDDMGNSPVDYSELVHQENEQARERCEKYLNKMAAELTAKGIPVRTQAVLGDAAEEIIKYANSNPFQLIVMASHGRSGVRHLIFGSVAERVVLEANVPILVVTSDNKP
jgi:nucleotide-binding universal stress UspA family protein